MRIIDPRIERTDLRDALDSWAAQLGARRWVLLWSDDDRWYRFGAAGVRDELLAEVASTRPGVLDRVEPGRLGSAGARLAAAGLQRLSAVPLDHTLPALVLFEDPLESLAVLGPQPSGHRIALSVLVEHARLSRFERFVHDLPAIAAGVLEIDQVAQRVVSHLGLDALVLAQRAPQGVRLVVAGDGRFVARRPVEHVDFDADWPSLRADPSQLGAELPGARAAAVPSSGVGDGVEVAIYVECEHATPLPDVDLVATLLGQALQRAAEVSRTDHRTRADERTRLATRLHEELSQRLASLTVQLDLLSHRSHASPVIDDLAVLRTDVVDALEALRSAIYELTPPEPGWAHLDRGLERFVVDHARARGLDATFSIQGTPRPVEPDRVSLLFAATQEAITNASKHAGVEHIEVDLEFVNHAVSVSIRDRGPGFAHDPEDGAPWGHQGLGVLKTRARLAGAALEIDASDDGTTVHVRVPVSEQRECRA